MKCATKGVLGFNQHCKAVRSNGHCDAPEANCRHFVEGEFGALKKAIEHETERDYEDELNPRCPHCGSEFNIERNGAWHIYADDGAETECTCDACQRKFTATTNCRYSFSTTEQGVEL